MNTNFILSSTSIQEIHDRLQQALINHEVPAKNALENIPMLIQTLFEKEEYQTASGLKKLKLNKLACESAFYCYQIATRQLDTLNETLEKTLEVGKKFLHEFEKEGVLQVEMEREYTQLREKYNQDVIKYMRIGKPLDSENYKILQYALILAKLLKINVPQNISDEVNFLPPSTVGFQEKLNYNGFAWVLNRQIEKRAIQDHIKNLEELSSPDDFLLKEEDRIKLKNDVISYKKITEFDYPSLTEQEINYFIKVVLFQAKLLGISLSEEQLALKEPLPIFGIDEELNKLENYTSPTYERDDEMECHFYNNLMELDLFSRYLQISRVYHNLKPDLWTSFFNQLDPKLKKTNQIIQDIEKEKDHLEKILYHTFNFKVPTLEEWEIKFGRLLACNHSYHFLSLTNTQKAGQSPWMFYANSSELNKYLSKVEKQLQLINQAIRIVSGDRTSLKKIGPSEQKAIYQIIQNYKGKIEDLNRRSNELNFTVMRLHRFLSADAAVKHQNYSSPEWNKFFLRGEEL